MMLSINYSADVLTSLINNTQYIEEISNAILKSESTDKRELACGFLSEFVAMCKSQAQILGQIYRIRPEMIVEVFVKSAKVFDLLLNELENPLPAREVTHSKHTDRSSKDVMLT
jgi:hypothetical protein